MTEKIKARQSLAVYVNNLKMVRHLKKFGRIQYVSKKMHYVILYTDQETIDQTAEEVKKQQFVKYVRVSQWPLVDPEMSDLKAAGIYNQEIDEDDRQ